MGVPDHIRALIGEVAARHNIKLDHDDPAFAIVTINQLMLERTLAEAYERMKSMPVEWELAAASIQGRAGERIAQDTKAAIESIAKAAAAERQKLTAATAAGKETNQRWFAIGMVAGALLLVLGVVIGKTL
jgi:hypothetical protein